jgi:putative Mg2+ transporter-C (MgtC) family protein
MNNTDLNILLRLCVSLILTGALGWEREQSGKAAGLRTHMLVGMGATLFVVLGELFMLRFQNSDQNIQYDPTRIIEAVVAGISFLGAGTIFVSRSRDRVHGLTTAASIWVTAAIGMLVALERYAIAASTTLLIFLVLRALNRFEKR